MATAAERMRRLRARRRAGERRFAFTARADLLLAALDCEGFLDGNRDDDDREIEAALGRMMRAYLVATFGADAFDDDAKRDA